MLNWELRIKPFAWLKRAWGMPLLVITCGLAYLGLFCLPWSTYKIEWPAWVQAIGSIGAVLVAILVANQQWLQQRRMKSDADAEALKKVVAIVRYAGKVSQSASFYLSLGDPERRELRVFQTKIRQSADLLAAVSYMDVPLSEAALGWVEVRHAVVEISEWFSNCLRHEWIDTTDQVGFNASNLRLQRAVVRVVDAARESLPDMPLDDRAV